MGWGDVISGALSIGGTLLGQHAAKEQNKVATSAAKAEAQAQYDAGLAMREEMNQQAADLDEMANRQSVAASIRAHQIQRQGYEQASQGLASYAASGVMAGEGSAGYIPAHIVGMAAEDVFTTMMNSNDQIFQLQAQAAANRRQGETRYQAGLLAKETGTDAAIAASKSINNAGWANTILNAGKIGNDTNWFGLTS